MEVSILILSLLMIPPDSIAQSSMQEFLPHSIRGWNVSEDPRSFPGRKIFEYMDGAGEVYLAYDFRDLLVSRYALPGQEEILVEVFDMGLSRNAYGIFTYMKGRGPAVPIGQNGEYKSGLLCFWKSRYFVCVKIENENEAAKQAVIELGSFVAASIREEGELPAILRIPPEEDYIPDTERYFFTKEILNIHFYVADENLLHLDGETECLLVRVKRDRSHLLIVHYPGSDRARAALSDFQSHYLPGTAGGSVRTEKGKWTASRSKDTYVLVVFDAPQREDALNTLDKIGRRLP